MKKFGLLFSFLLLTTQLAWGQTTINFDTAANWIQDGTIAFTSYANHAYTESGVTIQGTSVLRNTTALQDAFPGALGTYSMRINTLTSAKATITVSTGGVSTFSIKVRRWDASPMPNYTVKTSVDGGSNWTSLTNIDGTLLTTSEWFTYSGSVNDASDNIKIEIANNTVTATERIMIDDFTWTGYAGSTPTISITPTSLTGFTYVVGSGPSAEQTFTVSGTNLTNDISVAASTNYEISLSSGSGYTTPIKLTQSSGSVASTTIYVRLKAGLSVGDYNSEDITATSTDATNRTVTCSGSVTPSAVLSATPTTLTDFTYVFGSGPSTSQSYALTGTNLDNSDVVVTGSTNYEISLNDADWYASRTLTAYDGSEATIYVRLKSGLNIGTYNSEIISNAGGGATTENVTVSGNVTAPVSSLPMVENFDYTSGSDLAGQSFWQIIGVDGTNLLVSSSDLTYANYPASGGFSAEITSARADDLGKGFTAQSSGSLYYSFLVSVTGSSGTGTYFTSLNLSATSTFYAGRVYAKIVGTDVNFGLSKSSEAAIYSATNYVIGTTYLLVMKYQFIDGASNDEVSLFIFTSPTLPLTEPVTPDVGPLAPVNTDNSSLSGVLLRQGTGVPNLLIDGIRISQDWVEALLPVELTSFSATTIGSTIKLNWQTATEINNYGFEVERMSNVKGQTSDGWEKLGFVNGNGNSNSPKNYSFVDDNVTAGTYSYRLKQIDNDGQFEYSKVVEIGLTAPDKFELSQNYPNPFNPSTTINYNLPEASNVKLIIFNILGQEVKTLVNEFKEAGVHTVNFNASELNSGLYIYKIEAGSFTQTRKMTLIK